MITQELIDDLREAEESLGKIDAKLSNKEFMFHYEQAENLINHLREKACEALYQHTKHINSRDTVFQVYRHRITSWDLQSFLKPMNDEDNKSC